MTNQEALERIEELLRARKDRDPQAQVAWEAITQPGPNDIWDGIYLRPAGKVARHISDWPEGAVCGLLEHDICDTLEWEPDCWLLAPGAWKARIMGFVGEPWHPGIKPKAVRQARIIEHRGSSWHTGATRNEALAAAIIKALEANNCSYYRGLGGPKGRVYTRCAWRQA